MSLEHLWAGWRTAYVTGAVDGDAGGPSPDNPEGCVFCRLAASGPPAAGTGVLWRGDAIFGVLNAFPYTSGHFMVVPVRHVGALDELTDAEAAELWGALRAGVAALEATYRPEGINLGANLGRAAGAGIPRHLHLHAVPRWSGDTNFMTSVAEARVLPESLEDTWNRLAPAWPGG